MRPSPARNLIVAGADTVCMVPFARVTAAEPDAMSYVKTPEMIRATCVPWWKCSGNAAPGLIVTRWR
jgi:hypothetical protein